MKQHFDTIIIGGGLSGLTIAHTLRTSCYGHRFAILEKTDATGGVIRSYHDDGYIAEWGPHGFLDNCFESRQLLKDTGLDREAVRAPLKNFVRYVYLNGALRMIPQTPLKIAAAPLIPWKAKFRVLMEAYKPALAGDVTVAQWVEHRFGEALLPFADAVFTGTYAGDINRLTMDAVMPGVRKLETENGSLIRGMIARAKKARRSKIPAKKFTMPAMTSFPGGMERLPRRLTEYLQEGHDLFLGCAVNRIEKTEQGWQVYDANTKRSFQASNLVLAIPTNHALSLLAGLGDSPPVRSIPEAPLATVVFGFASGSTLPPGFGYLVPERENRFALGTLFSSNMFPGRAPSGHILFETLIGGRRHPERAELSDEQMISAALEDVSQILDLKGQPTHVQVLRPWGNIPQLEKDYTKLLDWRNRLVAANPGLFICGFGWEGIGINDMIKSGVKVAHDIRAGASYGQAEAAVKGVYF